MKDSNKSIQQKLEEITNKSENLAKAMESKIQAEGDHKATMADILTLSNELGDLHKSCDFILKNFELRQQYRGEEIEGLQRAIAILKGMK